MSIFARKLYGGKWWNSNQYFLRMSGLADEFFGTELFLHVVLTGAILGISAYLISVRFDFFCI